MEKYIHLDNLNKCIRNIVVKLFKLAKAPEIPSEFTVCWDVNEDTYADPVFYWVELPDGRKFGLDFEDLDWNDYTILVYEWTREPYTLREMTDNARRIDKIASVIVDICTTDTPIEALFAIDESILKQMVADAINRANIEIEIFDVVEDKKVKGVLRVSDKSILIDEDYITLLDYNVTIISENAKYTYNLWTTNESKEKFVDIQICSELFVKFKIYQPYEGCKI